MSKDNIKKMPTEYVLLHTYDGDLHAIPIIALRRIKSGQIPPENLGSDVLRKLVGEYIDHIYKKGIDLWIK